MSEPALESLLDIVRDPASGLRNRLSAAVAGSRVSRLAMPGEQEPEAVLFLREIVGVEHEGSRFRVEFRREAATALSYYERRCKKAELLYNIDDQEQRRETWRRVLNSAICYYCRLHGRQHESVLLTAADTFATPPFEPELGLAALAGPGGREQRRRAQRAIDERVAVTVWTASEEERRAVLGQVAQAIAPRIAMAPDLSH